MRICPQSNFYKDREEKERKGARVENWRGLATGERAVSPGNVTHWTGGGPAPMWRGPCSILLSLFLK